MRKIDLVDKIGDKTGIPKVDVMLVVEALLREIKQGMKEGESVYLRGFGSFTNKKRAAKVGRNIKKNTAVEIPEHFVPAFKPAREFIAQLNNIKADSEAAAALSED